MQDLQKKACVLFNINEFMFKNSKNCKMNVKQFYKCLGPVNVNVQDLSISDPMHSKNQ